MHRTFILVALLLIALISLTACGRTADTQSFITAPGKYELFDKQMTIEVVESPEGDINYTVTRGPRAVGHTKPPIRKNNQWFIHAATADAVWSYYGDNRIVLTEFSDRGSKFTDSNSDPALWQRAPAAFLDRLPGELKDR
jgi:hypothetical protein